MPRRPRVVIPGCAHHITQRGNNRQTVFHSPDDRRLYLELLKHHAQRCGTRILGYCLMTNHVHLVAVPDHENSFAGMLGALHSEYASSVNRSNGDCGHLWQSRFFSCPLGNSYLINALRYVDLNPVRASLVGTACDWPWSSARAHASVQARDPILDPGWTEYCTRGSWGHAEWLDLLSAEITDAVRKATRTGRMLL